ncbi:elongation factor 4 [Candidatus Uhrbacteria bacterium]|nr:elongation factor 4 [Candidatus Uhrbacteria bacterium]
MNQIRNFCIIAHIDHGKSTLADRFLELTGTVSHREMKEQILDQMDLERERGITIKLQPVRMTYTLNLIRYTLNLIDTPGHVDFAYEVSRSLAAVEGAILLVDATQGIQAQTLANLYLALEQNLAIIPAINKIDLPSARVEQTASELMSLLACQREDICSVSGKTGDGVHELLEECIRRVPPPSPMEHSTLRALIFDSVYDDYRGVLAYIRIVDGSVTSDDPIRFMASGAVSKAGEVGYFTPAYKKCDRISAGEIGYMATGLKSVHDCRVGDTIILATDKGAHQLPGYKDAKPMVFAGIFCKDGDQLKHLREGVEKLKANDAAFTFEPEHSLALGFGFRCGFLGMLHLEIIKERLAREYDLDIIVTVPSVAYRVVLKTGEERIIHGPLELPDENMIESIAEPWVSLDVVTPESTLGSLLGLVSERRGIYITTEYLPGEQQSLDRRVIVRFEIPLSGVIVDFYDALKSISSGYASMNYDLCGYRPADVVRMDIIVGPQRVDELSSIITREEAYRRGKGIVESLKKAIPRAQFEIKLQAAVGAKIIASERIAPFRKDVTSGLYGGDVTRKQKLLAKQKRGKKRMQGAGRVDIPTDAYLTILKR